MPNKNNVDKKISYANGDDNVIPMGPIPHEKPGMKPMKVKN